MHSATLTGLRLRETKKLDKTGTRPGLIDFADLLSKGLRMSSLKGVLQTDRVVTHHLQSVVNEWKYYSKVVFDRSRIFFFNFGR